MSDIVTTRIFTDGERGITAAKLNDITASSSIQPAFYTSKPTASTADPPDIALILKSGAYAQVPISTLAGSISTAQIWSTRLRSFNAIGNPNFEVDQRTAGAGTGTAATVFALDRWIKGSQLSTNFSVAQSIVNPPISLPGTNFGITRAFARFTLLAQKASLAVGDHMILQQNIEAPYLRELINDVHSLSLLVRSSVAPLTFSISLRDSAAGYSLTNLLTIPSANTWALLTFPNLPIWTASGNFPLAPGNLGYSIIICLAAGTSFISPAAGTWSAGNFLGAPGMSNFAASPVNSTFDLAFCQHEPGGVCTTLMDKPFPQNYDECLRYFQKSYDYATAAGASVINGANALMQNSTTACVGPSRFVKPMAKIPTVVSYAHNNGAVNSCFRAGVNYAVSSVDGIGDKGFYGITTAAMPAPAVGNFAWHHYTADTQW